MASVAVPTEISIQGPWLLDAESLENLDTLISKCMARMRERRDEELKERSAKLISRLRQSRSPEEVSEADEIQIVEQLTADLAVDRCRVIVYVGGGRSADGNSFEDLNTLSGMTDEVPRGFAARATVGNSEIDIELHASEYNRELRVRVKSRDDEFSREILGRLENWV